MSDLDDQLRRTDPDRWLSTRFIADAGARADVVALYAFNAELARVREAVREPLMGEIRLTWWREAMEEIAAGKPPRKHPLVEALAASAFDPGALADLAEARLADFDTARFADVAEVTAYLDATAGKVMALAAKRLDPAASPEQVRPAARAFGLAGLERLKLARLPSDWNAPAEVRTALAAARKPLANLPVAAFPAVAYAALAGAYARGRNPGDLEKRLRLTLAVALGRLS